MLLLEPALHLQLEPDVKLRLYPDHMGKIYELFDYWEHHPHLELRLTVHGEEHRVPYVLAPPAFLNYLVEGERFGLCIGDVMLVSSEIHRQHPNWISYIVVKLYMERFINPGLDESGRVQHWESLFHSIRLAASTLSPGELETLLRVLVKFDRTRYFEFDNEVTEFLDRVGRDPERIREEKRRYLENHHHNRWVRQGRIEEELQQYMVAPFRLHAEAVFQAVFGSRQDDLYLAAEFVQQMAGVEPDTPVMITPPCNRIAYLLTSRANGLVDLVRFVGTNPHNREEDIIVKVAGRNRTWVGLSRRLAFTLHQSEKQIQKSATAERDRLSGLTTGTFALNADFDQRLLAIREQVSQGVLLQEAIDEIQRLRGDWATELERLVQLQNQVAQRLRQFDEVTNALLKLI